MKATSGPFFSIAGQSLSDLVKSSSPLHWVLLYIALMFLPRIMTEGMFLDGLIYASISRNLAEGVGEMWKPAYGGPGQENDVPGPFFAGHPPLFFWLEGAFFKILGDHFWVERLFSAVVLLLSVLLLAQSWMALWRRYGQEAAGRQSVWLPLLLWYLMPKVIWAYPTNLLDNLLALWVLLAFRIGLTAVRHCARKPVFWLLGALMGATVLAGVLTKGPVGLLPLCFPLAFAAGGMGVSIRKGLALTGAVTGTAAALLALAWLHPDVASFFAAYADAQLIASVTGAGGETLSKQALGRWQVLAYLGVELLAPAVVVALGWALVYIRKNKAFTGPVGMGKMLFFIGLAGVLPLMISAKIRGFYLLPVLPFWAMWLAALTPRYVPQVGRPTAYGLFSQAAFAAACVGILAWCAVTFGEPGRDHSKLQLVETLEGQVPAGGKIAVCGPAYKDLAFHAYCQRYLGIHLSKDSIRLDTLVYDVRLCGPPDAQYLTEGGWVVAQTTGQYHLLVRTPQK